jgi:hypothetical protein
MIGFSATTAFRLVRRLAAIGPDSPSLYLLIADTPAMQAIQADIAAEVQVQLGVGLRALAPADVRFDRSEDLFAQDPDRPVALITLDRWLPNVVTALDRNIVLLTRSGAVLLLASPEVAERLLPAAPNLRNRLTGVFAIRLEEAFEGPAA